MKTNEFAVIDIGSNSLRLMTGRWDGTKWTFSPKQLETTRLGYQVEETHHLSPAGMAASFAAMERWNAALAGMPVCAVATSAVREAADGQAFLSEIRARFGWHCRAISGLEEAALSFCGAASGIAEETGAVVLDIGGGSSEVAVGSHNDVAWSHSYPLGAVRLTKKTQINAEERRALEEYCHEQWLPMPNRKGALLIGVGGTLTTLAAMELEMAVYDPARIEGCVISLDRLSYHIEKLCAMQPEERRHVAGLQPKRSDIIIAGLVIARSFLQKYGFDSIRISERDLLEGVFYRHSFHDAAWRGTDASGSWL